MDSTEVVVERHEGGRVGGAAAGTVGLGSLGTVLGGVASNFDPGITTWAGVGGAALHLAWLGGRALYRLVKQVQAERAAQHALLVEALKQTASASEASAEASRAVLAHLRNPLGE